MLFIFNRESNRSKYRLQHRFRLRSPFGYCSWLPDTQNLFFIGIFFISIFVILVTFFSKNQAINFGQKYFSFKAHGIFKEINIPKKNKCAVQN